MKPGIRSEQTFTVTEAQLAKNVGSGEVNVLATPMMIAAIEQTASESVKPYLEDGQTSVGISLNVTHSAATPLGMDFRVVTELTEISANGRILTFSVSAYDQCDQISEGTHQRAIVAKERFEARTLAKLKPSS